MIIARNPANFFSNPNSQVIILKNKSELGQLTDMCYWLENIDVEPILKHEGGRHGHTKIYCTLTDEQKFEFLMTFK